ncbi:unnamed protein product [Urochloa decumbens]|uniref:Thioredoxin domain-containing protein n=1 Tax=Urochloa decumbens TaxID=240449 RepID=A0ABC9B5X9_9POAL
MSLTSNVFPHPMAPRWWWIYYTIKTAQDFCKAEEQPQPVVLMFSADFNEACKVMKKPFRDMALAKKKQAIFCLVDVDNKLKDIVEKYRVEALPTFVLIKNGKEQKRAVGAKMDELRIIEGNI